MRLVRQSSGCDARRRQHEQRAFRAARPACTRSTGLLGVDDLQHLAALSDSQALGRCRRSPPRPRRRRRGRCRRAAGRRGRPTRVGCSACRRPIDRTRSAADPSTRRRSACAPSGVMTVPLGNDRSSAAAVTVPSRSTMASVAGAVIGTESPVLSARVQVEPEVADVGAALGVDHHVVAVERGEVAQLGVHHQSVAARSAAPCGRSSTPPACVPSGNQPRPLG